jgi:AraC-like DNA-binding protein
MPSHESLVQTLRLNHRLPAGELLRVLGVSRPTLMRMLRTAGDAVLAGGRTRRTAYAARRLLRGSASPLPLFEIDEQGRPAEVGRLHLAYPDGALIEGEAFGAWPLDRDMQDGWFAGIPYPLQDMRPDGYLGRAFAHAHAELLQVPADPRQWSDDDALHALSLLGADQSGSFIVGEAAYRL